MKRCEINRDIKKVVVLSYYDGNLVNICVEDLCGVLHVMSRKFFISNLGQYIKINGKRVYIKKER